MAAIEVLKEEAESLVGKIDRQRSDAKLNLDASKDNEARAAEFESKLAEIRNGIKVLENAQKI